MAWCRCDSVLLLAARFLHRSGTSRCCWDPDTRGLAWAPLKCPRAVGFPSHPMIDPERLPSEQHGGLPSVTEYRGSFARRIADLGRCDINRWTPMPRVQSERVVAGHPIPGVSRRFAPYETSFAPGSVRGQRGAASPVRCDHPSESFLSPLGRPAIPLATIDLSCGRFVKDLTCHRYAAANNHRPNAGFAVRTS